MFMFIGFISFASNLNAATLPNVYVLPATLNKNINEVFDVDIKINDSNSKVYAVEGKIVFDNLNCVSIKVSEVLMVQSTPSCTNPYFLIGIPQGTTKDTTLLSLKVSGNNAGDANISFTSIDVIGEGKSLSEKSIGGNYKIITSSTSGSYVTSKTNTVGSKISPTNSTRSTKSEQNKEIESSTETNPEVVNNNSQLALASMSIAGISIMWILIAIIVMLVIYIILRERSLWKKGE